MTDLDIISTLLSELEQLTVTPASRLLVSCPPGWVVVRSYTPANRLLVEFASNTHLSENHRLTEEQLGLLRSHGYQPRRKGRSIGKMLTVQTANDKLALANELDHLIQECFSPTGFAAHFNEDALPTIRNSELLGTMRQLSIKRTHELRLELYRKLLNATVIVALDGDGEPLVVDMIGAFPSFAVFTDAKSMLIYDSRGGNHRVDYGINIFPMLLDAGAGSVFINPKCDVRGELYQSELKTLSKAAGKFNRQG